MNKRGTYFFVLDAVISSIIILVTVYFILSLRTKGPESLQSYTQAEDFMDFMMQTEVRDFNGNYTKRLVEEGNITDTRRTLFQQMAEFHFYNKTNISWQFMEEVSNSSLLGQQGMMMWFDEDMMFNRSSDRYSKANLILSSKKMSFLRINQTYVEGPNLMEVWVWY
ncbi:MAG TPA: hypothetical protein VJG90_03445 [Candidatus Nanoarchaeia archaeon]|nr:hypothetical protein [Candidatus Nanoarchaeia archaeon]